MGEAMCPMFADCKAQSISREYRVGLNSEMPLGIKYVITDICRLAIEKRTQSCPIVNMSTEEEILLLQKRANGDYNAA